MNPNPTEPLGGLEAPRLTAQTQGWARVYLGPLPDAGSHTGLRGWIRTDERGIHALAADTEWLWPEPGEYDAEWFELENDTLTPWPRVFQIDWCRSDPRADPPPTFTTRKD